jgi:hypothetical protein
MDPAEISRQLQHPADESFKAGEPRKSRSGIAVTATHTETYWVATLDPILWATPRYQAGDPNVTASDPEAIELGDVNPSISDRPLTASSVIAQLTPREATALRMRFGIDLTNNLTGTLGTALSFVCVRLMLKHASLLNRIRTEGGAVRLLVTLSPKEVRGFSLVPEVSLRLGQLGVPVEFEFAES